MRHYSSRLWALGFGLSAASTPSAAQVREGTRTPLDEAKVTFGYVCDDRFVVSNEGNEPLRLEYGLDRASERTALNLGPRESVDLLLSTSDQLNLMANGQVIASAHNEGRSCDDDRPRVVVRRPSVVISPVIVVRPRPYYHYDPWWTRHHHHRVRVYTVVRFPIIIGGRDRDRGRDRSYDRGDRGRDNRGRDNGAWGRDRGRDADRGRGRRDR